MSSRCIKTGFVSEGRPVRVVFVVTFDGCSCVGPTRFDVVCVRSEIARELFLLEFKKIIRKNGRGNERRILGNKHFLECEKGNKMFREILV